ncbi:I-type lectin protein 1, partial [Biomphalaria glabrata]
PIQDSLQNEEAGVQLWVILLIVGLLILLVAVIIVVVFIKTNFPRNTYPLEKTELKHHLNPEEDLLNQSFQEI